MKHLINILILTLVTSFYSCQSNPDVQKSQQDTKTINDNTPGLTKDIIDNNSYIDVDITTLSREIAGVKNPARGINEKIEDDIAKAKAAIYRFYSNVTVTEDGYVLGECTAAGLNMSETTFNALSDNLNEMNDFLRKSREEGKEVTIAPIDDEYLQSLLK